MADNMPTAARLVAALALGIVSAAFVYVLIAFYPEERFERDQIGLHIVFGGVGALVGWLSLGKRIKSDGGTGIFLGLRAALVVIIWIIFVLSVNFVIQEIIKDKFTGAEPMAAIFQMFAKGAEYFTFLLNGRLVAMIAFAGVTVGVLTRNTHHKWR